MANIRIKDLPLDGAPKSDDQVPIDLGTTRRTTVEDFVFAGRPTATKTEAETGADPKKAMTPLTVKQAIDAQTGTRYVPVTRRVDSGTGLSGGQELTGDITLSLNSASVASLAKADSAVQSVNGKSGNSVTITPADVGAAPSSIVADVNANTAERHSHTNKAILDATTASFLAAEKTKLSGIESGAQVNTVNSVNTKMGAVVLNAADVGAAPDTLVADINANISARHTHSNKAILDATTASFLAADKTKLTGIEAGAQVNTVTSVAGKTGAVTLVKGDVGLGNVDNTSDASKPVSTATQTALNAKANSSVTVSAGTGLTGGGNLTANRSVALNAASIASLAKADTALQAPGGTTGQILAKNSNTTNDVGWVSSEAATAVSYGPQTLTESQQAQARKNISADIMFDSKAALEAASVSAEVNAIYLSGYNTPGDGRDGLYQSVDSEPLTGEKVQSADGGWWSLVGYKRPGVGTVNRFYIQKFAETFTPQDYGAMGDGTASDDKLADAVAAAVAESKTLIIPGDVPAGYYSISSPLIVDMSSSISMTERKRPAIRGESAGDTIIRYNGPGACLRLKGSSVQGEGHHSFVNVSDLTMIGPGSTSPGVYGVEAIHQAYLRFDRVTIDGFDIGLNAKDLEFSKFNACNFRWNKRGVFLDSSGSDPNSSHPNGNTFRDCEISLNSQYGLYAIGGTQVGIFDSHIQYNGIPGGFAPGDVSAWGVRVQNAGFQGGVGLNMSGCYVEHNTGQADVWLNSDGFAGGALINPVVHNIISTSFSRVTRTGSLPDAPAPYNIYGSFADASAGISKLNVIGCAFKYYNDYIPNAANKVIYFDPGAAPMDPNHLYEAGNLYMSSLEKPILMGNQTEGLITPSKTLPSVGWPGQILVNDANGVPYIWTSTDGVSFGWRMMNIT